MQRYIKTVAMIESEPEKWLARKAVLHVKAFLSGFLWMDAIGAENLQRLVPLVNGFAQFLAAKYSDSFLDYSEDVALSQAGYDDEESFQLYFREWRAFCSEWNRDAALTDVATATVRIVDLSKLLSQMRAKPGMYLSGPSVGMLYSFVRGVQRSCECYAPGARIEPDFGAYEAWLSEQAPLKKLCRWDRLLLAECSFDEKAALFHFFETLDKFRKRVTH
jgi:hypothetical protein